MTESKKQIDVSLPNVYDVGKRVSLSEGSLPKEKDFMTEETHGDMKFKYLYRHDNPSNEEGFRPIQIRVNDKDTYVRIVTLSSGRFFFPFSLKDIDLVIKELLFVRENFKAKELKP